MTRPSSTPGKKSILEEMLDVQLRAVNLRHLFEREYRFHKTRRWRADFAAPSAKLLVECEGGIWLPRGAHSGGTAITRDAEKSNAAQLDGWMILRFTKDHIKSGEAIDTIERAVKMRASDESE